MRWQLESLMTAARVSCNGSTTFSWTSFFNLRCQGDESLLGCWLLQDVGAGLRRKRKRHAHSVATTAGWAAGACKASARWEPAPERLSLLCFLPIFPAQSHPGGPRWRFLSVFCICPPPPPPWCGDASWPLGLSSSRRFPPYSVRQDSPARPASRSGVNASLWFFFPCGCLLPAILPILLNFRVVVLKWNWILPHLSLWPLTSLLFFIPAMPEAPNAFLTQSRGQKLGPVLSGFDPISHDPWRRPSLGILSSRDKGPTLLSGWCPWEERLVPVQERELAPYLPLPGGVF